MDQRTRQDLYREFMEFIHEDIRRQRRRVSRRMFSVLLWCFILPALGSLVMLLGVRMGVLPRWLSRYTEWLVLVFPISYSLYVLGSEVLKEIPAAFRKGGTWSTLAQSMRDCEWRSRIAREMKAQLRTSAENWRWIVANFRIDLTALRQRTRFLTGLGGAVFFLLMQGIDQLGEKDVKAQSPYDAIRVFFEASSTNFSQFVGLGLFLVLFYLSGSETFHSLSRYLDCGELVIQELEGEKEPKS